MNERPYVQYHVESNVSELVATTVYRKLEYLYNYSESQEKFIEPRNPRGTLLIVDRTFDLVSPFIHDYHY